MYVAVYFLLPYTEMFCKKYYPDASPCLIAFLLLGCCVYAAVKGVNVITRFGIFLFVLAMTTNLLLFGGCVSSLDFQNGGAFFSGEPEDFLQDMLYFATPCFIAALFACLCGSAKQFRTRHVTIALLMTGVKYALVLFFIVYAVGAYAARQEYRTFVLSRVAHFGSFSGIESFYMALSTMSVFMILSLLLCGVTKSAGKPGSLPLTAALTGGIFVLHWLAELFPFVRECFTRPLLLIGFSFLTAVVLPSVLLIQKRRQHA
ncbi:MAG: GerAB/ArcD/ProY family transporter [Ruminococcus sp.]|nr:GerAB/ArcD/ProY family transporter [Ruminococcus sp.]